MAQSRPDPKPLDAIRLEQLALAYVARFATSQAKVAAYLSRKLRERGWEGEGPPPIAEIAERFVAAGYIDDEAYARAKSGSLLRRGYGMRRVGQALSAAGIEESLRENVRAGEREQRQAALAMAKKRRFGPYAREEVDKSRREKQIAAMLRAGHAMDHALQMINARTQEAAEQWVAEGMDEV